MNKTESIVQENDNKIDDKLPANNFSETDLHKEWDLFLEKIKKENSFLYNAIGGFRLVKEDEDTICINYPSETAKSEFDKVQGMFFNHFKKKVNHHKIKINYKMDATIKKEIVTKRSLFDKMAEKNPLLSELNEIFKFDLS